MAHPQRRHRATTLLTCVAVLAPAAQAMGASDASARGSPSLSSSAPAPGLTEVRRSGDRPPRSSFPPRPSAPGADDIPEPSELVPTGDIPGDIPSEFPPFPTGSLPTSGPTGTGPEPPSPPAGDSGSGSPGRPSSSSAPSTPSREPGTGSGSQPGSGPGSGQAPQPSQSRPSHSGHSHSEHSGHSSHSRHPGHSRPDKERPARERPGHPHRSWYGLSPRTDPQPFTAGPRETGQAGRPPHTRPAPHASEQVIGKHDLYEPDSPTASRRPGGVSTSPAGREVLPVLPLGAGIASIGLGLAFLALRMRRR